ncbi:hypothetical protein OAA60_00800 [Porticoccaceae bacterium]|nr:hypothetical protein [Porticoccaceae bacterium]
MSEIDKTNIDAKYWADYFCNFSPETDADFLTTYFANYRFAVSDPLEAKVAELEAERDTYKAALEVIAVEPKTKSVGAFARRVLTEEQTDD